MKDFTPTSYTLECVATGREFPDEGWTLDDAQCKCPSLIRTRYAKKQLELKSDEYGFYKFADWLPVRRMLENSKAPVTYKSKGLAAHLGLENLYITFNGYYPAIGAHMTTCSFKETEAYSVCARIDENEKRVLVVASAGNTARAFAKVCSDNNIKLLLSVPYDNIDALWFDEPLNPCVKLISCDKGGDYFDAIYLSDLALKGPGGVSGRSHHQHAPFVGSGAAADRIGFGLFERTRGHRGSDGRIIAVEGDPEVFQPEVRGEALALIGHGSRRTFEDTPHGHPVRETVQAPVGGLHVDLFAGVFGAHERRLLALRVGKHPAGVFEFAARGDTFQRVGGRCEIFHEEVSYI